MQLTRPNKKEKVYLDSLSTVITQSMHISYLLYGIRSISTSTLSTSNLVSIEKFNSHKRRYIQNKRT